MFLWIIKQYGPFPGIGKEDSFLESLFSTSAFQTLSYIIIIGFLLYFFVRLQTLSLLKARRLLKEKESAYQQIYHQREELELKNRNITDSLLYAQKIQRALLPSDAYIRSVLQESFVFYKPRDIVSGDFYWIREIDNQVFVAAADCTGHGVPGALMSMIGFDLLDNILTEQKIRKPSEILSVLSKGVERVFAKDQAKDVMVQDGMDLGVCALNTENNLLEYAGAFFPLYLVRDNKLKEIKGDKFSVGYKSDRQVFNNHTIPLQKGDMFYLFSDGYADQFGGPYEKKFMYRRFRRLLLTIHKFDMQDQRLLLEDSIRKWMRDQEQVDDMMIIGIRAPEPGFTRGSASP